MTQDPGGDRAGEVGARERVDVLVVGAGFAGLGAALRLARRGRESFVVLERGDDVGGTWRDNTYPGVASDVPAHLYSFSFAPRSDWSRVFAPGAEIQDYLRACGREVAAHVRLRTEVRRARWDEDELRWHVETTRGRFSAGVLVLAAGRLTEPRIPDLPGLADFDGPVFHTSRWEHGVDLTRLRVAVVGTGASAVQVLPRLAGSVRGLTVFQRSAPYVVPRDDAAYSPRQRAEFARAPERARELREQIFIDLEQGVGARRAVPHLVEAFRHRALEHLRRQVGDPVLRAALTPDYEVGCKRVLLSDEFYPALQRPGVELVPAALQRFEGSTAVAGDGSRREVDAVVLATGFHASEQPYAHLVLGRAGRTLAQEWAGGMVSHASTVVHGFPNAFVLDGPNASLGHNSAVHVIESQLGYLVGALDHLALTGSPLEVSAAAQLAYTDDIDRMAQDSVWVRGGCTNWYVDPRNGRLTLLWPDTAAAFRERNGTFDPQPFVTG
ncbi:MAG: flavin-containing monooxygenase [Janthinobacterium lividum]